ncbi:hypothetical protein Pcinc_035547 [Petrolisthes cinctipes]|uniref:Uncharacterized protein n=1 Tax=Petrolisthes cinctipes TaxID=88211 RepID=A0AAE1EPU6_PETCI|nr:hypothetical protein Pcinc_035547 [Petrolisthes cinctipes]
MSITGRVSSGHTHSYSHLSPLHQALTTTTLTTTLPPQYQALTTTTLTTTPLTIHHTIATPIRHHHTNQTQPHITIPKRHNYTHYHTKQTPQHIHHRCLGTGIQVTSYVPNCMDGTFDVGSSRRISCLKYTVDS